MPEVQRDSIRLRLPLKSEYLPVLRMAAGVIAGVMTFNYDEIVQLRVAVSEAFSIAIRNIPGQMGSEQTDEVEFRFTVSPDKLEVLVVSGANDIADLDKEDTEESRALLESLTDEVEFGGEQYLVRMVKHLRS